MLNHTTSYPPKRPHPRRNQKTTGYQLPRGRARAARRPGATYLNHSQGFGSAGRRGYGVNRAPRLTLRQSGGRRNNARRSYAIVIVGCALLFFVASVIWYLNRGVTITLNGEEASIHINGTVAQLIENEGLDEQYDAGDLLAVDDSVLERGGGDRYSVQVNGKKIAMDDLSNVQLSGGEKVKIADGADKYEKHDVKATKIEPTITVDGTGAIGYVKTWGVPGRSEVWTGKQSGIVKDRGVVQKVQNCEVVYRSVTPDKGNYVALTFDEGPSEYTQKILDVLNEKGVKATFFLQGKAVEENVAAAKAIADAGHELGSNAYTDTNLTKLSDDDLRSQLTSGFDAIKDATGTSTCLLRAPYAAFSAKNWAEGMDLVSAVVSWNLDSGDWLLPGASSVVDTVVGSVRNGNIVLLTDNDATGSQTAEALGDLIDQLQDKGYKLVTLSELVATDKDLAKELDLSQVSMPDDAVLPSVAAKDAAGDANTAAE